MGKSIIHCADCGNAVREDDFARGKASTIDQRTYCSHCRAVSAPPSPPLPLQKSSTSKIPVAAPGTRRTLAAAHARRALWPLWGGGALVVVSLAILAVSLSGKSGKRGADEAMPSSEPASRGVPVSAARKARLDPEPKPADLPPVPESKPEEREAKPEPKPEPKSEPEKPKEEPRPEPKADKPDAETAKPEPTKPKEEPKPEPRPEPKPEPKAEPPPAAAAKKEPLPQVDQKKVDQAVKKGIAFLVSQVGKPSLIYAKNAEKECRSEEFVLWTFVHAGVPENTAVFRHLFKTVTEAELKRTYEAALQAMILEELDRVRYQPRILQCAQFLLDNQCANGQWHYGTPEPPSKDVPTLPLPTATRSSGSSSTKERQKPAVVQKLKVTARRTGPSTGDNSNSQYAALGIRSCDDAGIVFPEEALQRARKWWRTCQHPAPAGGGSSVATGAEPAAPPAGWCYLTKTDGGHNAYGSMTAGAVGALAIYDTILGDDWRKDRNVASGLSWLSANFGVEGNPGPPSETWCKGNPRYGHFYFLYALERAGVLCRTEWIGRHPWYFEGAGFLLANQEKDGSWSGSVTETCFAILFLKRATRPLEDVASLDDKGRK